MSWNTTRRGLLAAAGRALVGAFLLAGAARALWRPTTAGGRGDWTRRLVASVREPESAAWVGRRYLASAPEEADAARLAAALSAGLAPDLDGAALRRALAAGRRRDFAQREIVVLDGWVLSRSELRLCALVALCSARGRWST